MGIRFETGFVLVPKIKTDALAPTLKEEDSRRAHCVVPAGAVVAIDAFKERSKRVPIDNVPQMVRKRPWVAPERRLDIDPADFSQGYDLGFVHGKPFPDRVDETELRESSARKGWGNKCISNQGNRQLRMVVMAMPSQVKINEFDLVHTNRQAERIQKAMSFSH